MMNEENLQMVHHSYFILHHLKYEHLARPHRRF